MLFIYDSDVNERFPTVGIIGAGQLARMSVAPATALGINLLLFAQDKNDSAAQIAPPCGWRFPRFGAVIRFRKEM